MSFRTLQESTGAYYSRVTGITPENGKAYKCVMPNHKDSHPSMVYYGTHFWCFACKKKIDTFVLANIYHNLTTDIDSPDFMLKTVPHIQKILELSDLEAAEYTLALRVDNSVISDMADYFTHELTPELPFLTEEQSREYGVGILEYPHDMIMDLAVKYNRTIDEIEHIIPQSAFGADRLTFLVRNSYGTPVGFIVRNLNWEHQNNLWEKLPKQEKEQKKPPAKYYSYVPDNEPFLYGIDHAICCNPDKKTRSVEHLYIVESAKAATYLWSHGISNVVATGTSMITKQQFAILSAANITKITLMLDNDVAGSEGTYATIINSIIQDKFFDFSVVRYPEATENKYSIDDIAVDNGEEAALNTIYNHRPAIQFMYEHKGEEAYGDIVRYIAHNGYNGMRTQMISLASSLLDMDPGSVRIDVESLIAKNNTKSQRAMLTKAKVTIERSLSNLNAGLDISKELNSLNTTLNNCNNTSTIQVFDQKDIFSSITDIITVNENRQDTRLIGWRTGFEFFDVHMEGMPKTDSTIIFGGGFNIGKSSFVINLCANILQREENEDIYIGMISNDDSRQKVIPKFISNLSGIPITQCKHINKYILKQEQKEVYKSARDQFLNWISPEDPKLGLYDVTQVKTYEDIISFVKYIQDTYQKTPLIVIDNFHNILLPGAQNTTSAREDLITRFHNATMEFKFTLIATAEIRKLDNKKPKARPTAEDLKDTIRLGYVPTIVGMLWSSEWAYGKNGERAPKGERVAYVTDPDGTKVPILECYIDKNKADMVDETANKTTLYFKMYGHLARFVEISKQEHTKAFTSGSVCGLSNGLSGIPGEDRVNRFNARQKGITFNQGF